MKLRGKLREKMVEALLAAGKPARHGDGQGLYLVIAHRGAAHWEKRYASRSEPGRTRYMGLGSAFVLSLTDAREANRQAGLQIAAGLDPLQARRDAKAAAVAAAVRALSFGQAAEEYLKAHRHAWKNEKHTAQWLATMLGRTLRGQPVERDWTRSLRQMPVKSVGTPEVLAVLKPIWTELPTTASRIRSRIEAVISWATAGGYREPGPNPASWDLLQHLLPSTAKIAKVEHFESVPYRQVPAFVAALRTREGMAARALELLVLTATRTSEILHARWEEFPEFPDGALWVIPAERMKGAVEHRVPLSPAAVELLRKLPREDGNPFVFLGARRNRPMSDIALNSVMKRMGHSAVPHGFRSSFSNWATERSSYSHLVIETCLAHQVGGEVERSYRRTDLLADRRRLMEQWATFIGTVAEAAEDGKVVAIRG